MVEQVVLDIQLASVGGRGEESELALQLGLAMGGVERRGVWWTVGEEGKGGVRRR